MVRKLLTALATAAIATVAAGGASANAPGNAYTVHPLRTTASDASS
jgi:hypothetical protein